ncbi:NmrA-domain-containing protein [Tothia fuscella]|uniref:NmrA-domain-containing protein n=1 Tax=Tothia fuscella TaxID=1048955 RepID=A0A9P4P566_9PEZI|nr:NmrA-domain-containing protein [Tothia fuscella]
MTKSVKTVVVVNSSGRQGASFARSADAVGWRVRAHMKDKVGIVAEDICSLTNVTVFEGPLTNPKIIDQLFEGSPDLAFINTVHWGNEVAIGKALVDAAKKAGVKHLVYSSMPNHAAFDKKWKTLPMWATKVKIEEYIRELGLPATFVYTGIYHNNFTSLNYPLFQMELQEDDSFEWQAPFHPDKKLPWLDAEHDVGPAVLQIFMDGPRKWADKRIPLAYQYLTPLEVCEAFGRALYRPIRYVRGPITYQIPVPTGYREHLQVFEDTLGKRDAPYFGPDLEAQGTQTAEELWEGNRDMEEYAKEIFPIEERNNGCRWMDDDESDKDDPKVYQISA